MSRIHKITALPVLAAAFLIASFFFPTAYAQDTDQEWIFVAVSTELVWFEDGPLAFGDGVMHADAIAQVVADADPSEKLEARADLVVEVPGAMSGTRGFRPVTDQFGQRVTVSVTVPGKRKPKSITKLSGTLREHARIDTMGVLGVGKQLSLKKLKKKLGKDGSPVTFAATVSGGPDVERDTRATAIYTLRRPNPKN